MQVYVLSNCDKCRAALKWLREQDIAHSVIDIRKDGIEQKIVENAIADLGWQSVLNKRSTTWRELDEIARENIDDAKAVKLIANFPTLMKRPLFVMHNCYLTGFDSEVISRAMGKAE